MAPIIEAQQRDEDGLGEDVAVQVGDAGIQHQRDDRRQREERGPKGALDAPAQEGERRSPRSLAALSATASVVRKRVSTALRKSG